MYHLITPKSSTLCFGSNLLSNGGNPKIFTA
nr:maturase K [Uncaria scandens]